MHIIYWQLILEFMCVGGWETEVAYSSLPGVASTMNNEMNLYSSNMFGFENTDDFNNNNYFPIENEEESVCILLSNYRTD